MREDNIVNTVEICGMPGGGFFVVNGFSTSSAGAPLRRHHYPFLDLPVNLGIGGNVQCGYLYAVRNGYDVPCRWTATGQHDPPPT